MIIATDCVFEKQWFHLLGGMQCMHWFMLFLLYITMMMIATDCSTFWKPTTVRRIRRYALQEILHFICHNHDDSYTYNNIEMYGLCLWKPKKMFLLFGDTQLFHFFFFGDIQGMPWWMHLHMTMMMVIVPIVLPLKANYCSTCPTICIAISYALIYIHSMYHTYYDDDC